MSLKLQAGAVIASYLYLAKRAEQKHEKEDL